MVKTYSSCVSQPVQRLFFSLSASLNHRLYSADARDAYGHTARGDIRTYLKIDDAFHAWYKWKHNIDLDRKLVIPVERVLQGHPEGGARFEAFINSILSDPDLAFKSTTHDKCIYRSDFEGKCTLLLRQVDDFTISCESEDTAKRIFNIIGKHLQVPSETDVPMRNM